ncbi:G protein-activated inward rectifier potassium channel 3-like [Anoplophora glabripennis]|uniref:G protein-activated inward rectifier potassium channel 3-like n=1 Tax=Anoplophora glabripennis TaxID=217634 RepID=UPI0008757BB1|nr:G protein-activated inward rectifier potassium channel 3-like [Anoplophora glabripennis]
MEKIIWIANKIKDKRRRPFGPPIRNTNLKRRAILKNGEYNILPPKFPRRYIHYVHDIFTSLVDAEWKWTLQVLGIGFTGGWLIFSLIWWLIAFVHKDLHEDHLPSRQVETGWTPCVLNIHGFPSCFLFSLETQHTTGYGLRVITEECPEAIFIMCCQCIIGMIIDGFTVGVVIAKLMRPRLTNFTIQFSRNAVVAPRNGELCMMFRAGDLRMAPLVGASIRAILIHNRKTKEGEKLKFFETDLEVEVDSAGSDLFFLWPITIVHRINEDSPFYQLSAADMLRCKFEIILILEGTIESTGQGTNAQTSYLANEILWGHRFDTMVCFNDEHQCYEANYDKFEKTLQIQMPMCSAADLKDRGSQNLEETIKPATEISEEDKESLELPYTPNRRKNEQRNGEDTVTKYVPKEPQQRSVPSGSPPRYTSSETRHRTLSLQNESHRPNEYAEDHSPRPLFEQYPSRRHTIELDGSIQRPKLIKPSASRYKYTHYTQYENIPEEEERSETPPFPISWV